MSESHKIVELDALAHVIADSHQAGKRVVHCHGVFDLLHPGHIRHFKAAKAEGDLLIVTLTPDEFVNKGPGRPVFNHRLRAEWIAALEMVDYVAVNKWPSAVETIRLLRPDVFVKGSEFAAPGSDVTGHISAEEQAIREVGGRLHLTDDITFSSSRLLNSYFSDLPSSADAYLQEFRRKYTSAHVIDKLRGLEGLRVAVVGDAIIDEYCFCKPMGLGSKASAINARFLSTESQAGGALAVANHVAAFCRRVQLVTCVGGEATRQDTIMARLKSNISTKFFIRPGVPTITKRRFVTPFLWQKLFELTEIDDSPLPAEIEDRFVSHLEDTIQDFDVVIVADFGHGLLGPRAIETLCRNSKFLALNVQTNSANTGFNLATKYPRADFLCLDEEELRLAVHDRFGDISPLIQQMSEQLRSKLVAITQGQRGSLVRSVDGTTAQAPIFSQQVLDTLGAGDAYLSLSTLCAASGLPLDLIAFIGNCAGALMVRELGNRISVEPVPLFRFITTLLK